MLITEHVAMTALALSEAAEERLHIDRESRYPGLHRTLASLGSYEWRSLILNNLAPAVDAAWHLLNYNDGDGEWHSATEELDLMAFDFEFCPLALTALTKGDGPIAWDASLEARARWVARAVIVPQTFARFARAVAA